MTHEPVFVDPSSGKPWVAWFASGTPAHFKSQWQAHGGKISLSIGSANITHFFSMKKHEETVRRVLDTDRTILYHPSWIEDSVSAHFAKPLGHYVLEDHFFIDEAADEKKRTNLINIPRFRSPEISPSRNGETCVTVQRTSSRTPPLGAALQRCFADDRSLDNRSDGDRIVHIGSRSDVPFDGTWIDSPVRMCRVSIRRTAERDFLYNLDSPASREQPFVVIPCTTQDAAGENISDRCPDESPSRNARPVTSPSTLETSARTLKQPSNSLPESPPQANRTRRKVKRKADDDDFFEPLPAEMIDVEDDFFSKTGTYSGDALLERVVDLSARLLEGDTRYRAVMKKAAI